jgi:hemerythrin-like domain-containing protein
VDIYALLKADHDRVKQLFVRIDSAEDGRQRDRLFQEIRKELMLHKEAEERTFYAALSVLPQMTDRIEEGLEEHADIEELLEELDGLDGEEDDFLAQLDELREEVEHHVEEEEGGVFERARQLLSAEQAAKIAREFEAEKEKLSA